MTISKEVWKNYIDGLDKVDATVKLLVMKYIETHDIEEDGGRDALIAYCYGLTVKYGEAAAEFACQFYDAVSELEEAYVDPAEPAEPPSIDEVAKTVNGTLKYVMALEVTSAAIGRLVKRTGQDTTLKNAIRDGAFYAWIPSGDTCAFCLSIAAEGWKKATAKALAGGHAEHIHGNCNCAYSIKHNKETKYSSYDPSEYQEIMSQAEGSTQEEKLNSIRRMFYDENSAKIRAQKRNAYETHKELESSEAEEIDVN